MKPQYSLNFATDPEPEKAVRAAILRDMIFEGSGLKKKAVNPAHDSPRINVRNF